MKKIQYILIILLLSIPVLSQAQQNSGHEKNAKYQAQGLKKQFSLTDDQAARCEQIILKYSAGLSDTYKSKGDSTQRIKKREQLMQERDQEIKAVLTSDQSTRFDKWMVEKKQRKGKGVKNGDK